MKTKTVHEPAATRMSSREAIADADRVKSLLLNNVLSSERAVELRIPLVTFLAALEKFERQDLLVVKKRLDAKPVDN